MASHSYQFDRFTFDGPGRRLARDGAAVDLPGRYFDALALLLAEAGGLVSKDRFMAEVWRGVPVTDEALTQCMRVLRRQLGDDAARPRFIETVPRYGYRFIAPVTDAAARRTIPAGAPLWRPRATLAAAGMAGGGIAGIVGGLLYGLGVDMGAGGVGATSTLFVLLAINMLVGLAGGAGIGVGLALADPLGTRPLAPGLIGSALGGFVTGAIARLVGLDAFRLLFGDAPRTMTGALEGAVLGLAVGLAVWIAQRRALGLRQGAALGGLMAGLAGLLVALAGGRLLGGSLALLLDRFPRANVRLDAIGALFGEAGFGPASLAATAAIEGLLFGACMAAAIHIARQMLRSESSAP